MPNKVKVVEIDQFREKLIELIRNGRHRAENICNENIDCQSCVISDPNGNCKYACIADHLIANGVTLKDRDIHWATEQAYKNGYEKGKQDAVKWISVKDRLPEKHQNVLTVRTTAGNERIEFDFISSKGEWYGDTFYKCSPVTYWLPFPQPPKGE